MKLWSFRIRIRALPGKLYNVPTVHHSTAGRLFKHFKDFTRKFVYYRM